MNAYQKLPEALLDYEGYPTKEWIIYLKEYIPDDSLPVIDFVEKVLADGWWMPDWGFRLHRRYNGKRKLELHTGGWSGNEEAIRALLQNIYLTRGEMQYVQWRTGGHYYFEIRAKKTR